MRNWGDCRSIKLSGTNANRLLTPSTCRVEEGTLAGLCFEGMALQTNDHQFNKAEAS